MVGVWRACFLFGDCFGWVCLTAMVLFGLVVLGLIDCVLLLRVLGWL